MPVYVQFILATWGPLLFAEVGVTDLARSASLASLQGVPAPFGLLFSGLLADRILRVGLGRKLVIAATLACVAVAVAGMGLVVRAGGPAWLLAASMSAASFFMWCAWGPAYAILGELVPPSVLGKAFGLYNSTCFIGAIVGPLVAGMLKDLTGSFAGALFGAAALTVGGVITAMALSPAFRLGAPRLAARKTP
jgi:MFS family permease